MGKYLSKRERFHYINLVLLVLVINFFCSGPASAYDPEGNQEADEICYCESETDENMDTEFHSDAEFTENTAADCFSAVNGEAAGGFSSRLSAEDYDCLLRIVEAEAGVCDEKGKILVANVVLNRMETEEFPDTVREVVYQERQFSPVSSGRIDEVTITDETVEAVRKALNGIDYSEGALFFVARKHAEQENLNWFDNSLEFLFEHDGHEFFKCKSQ